MKRGLILVLVLFCLLLSACQLEPETITLTKTATITRTTTVTSTITSTIHHNTSLQILSVTSPVKVGHNATLKAIARPGAYCTITVYYMSGKSEASGLTPKAADSTGNVSWTWKVGTNTTPGTWKIVVSASIQDTLAAQAANNAIARGEDPNAAWVNKLTTISQTTQFTVYN